MSYFTQHTYTCKKCNHRISCNMAVFSV